MRKEILLTALASRAAKYRIRNESYDMAVFVNDHIGEAVIAYGKYDKQNLEMTEKVLKILSQSDNFKNGICLDIGANIGNHSLFYSAIFRRVFAFEPNPIAYKLLEANVLKNNIANIMVFKKGLGSKKEEKVLHICSGNLGMSSLLQLGESEREQNNLDLNIDIAIGDDLIDEVLRTESSKISFIKLDIEGFEIEALKGLRKTILEHSPVIATEFNFSSAIERERSLSVVNLLKEFGYKQFFVVERVHAVRSRYLDFVTRLIFGEHFVLLKLDEFESEHYHQVFCVGVDNISELTKVRLT